MESPRRKRFLAQVPPWDYEGGWQIVMDDPPPGDVPVDYNQWAQMQREAAAKKAAKRKPTSI